MRPALAIHHAMIILSLYSLEMTTFVRVVYTQTGIMNMVYFSPMMSSGMVRTAHPLAHAVSSTISMVYEEPAQHNQ